jgi:hypothetical protein
MLFSSDFRSVDEPTHSAVALFQQMYGDDPILPPFVATAFDSVKNTKNLATKRALWLVLMRSLPPIAQYVTSNARRPDRAVALAAWLEVEVERLFTGGYHAHDEPLSAFVEAAQVFFNTHRGV